VPAPTAPVPTVAAAPVTSLVVVLGRIGLALRVRLRCIGLGLRTADLFARVALDDLIELTAIQPDASAFWAVVYLNALSLAHDQIDPAGGAKKAMTLGVSSGICRKRRKAAQPLYGICSG